MTRAEEDDITAADDEPDADDLEEEDEDEATPPAPGEEVESSLDELLAKREKSESEATEETVLDEDPIPPTPGREERVETLSVKVVPQQPTEFTCRNCFLVKHRSQLANKKKMFCRDCA